MNFGGLLAVLSRAQVDYIVIGGVAAFSHGSARLTADLDVVYSRAADNVTRLTAALAPLHPYLRGAPLGLPFRLDDATVLRGLNFTLTTDLGPFDMLGEVVGGGGYEQLLAHSTEGTIYDVRCRRLDLDTLIAVKRAAGRPKDFEAIAELEIIRDLQRGAADR